MRIIVQHNFTSGLGDFIADVSHYMTILKPLKEQGYSIDLRISLRTNKYVDSPFFRELFDEETCNYFSSIVESNETISDLEFDGCKYLCSNHSPQSPGLHHFDLFFDTPPTNFGCRVFDAQKVVSNGWIPEVMPKMSNIINERVEKFWGKLPENYFFLHIRTSDILDENKTRYDRIITRVLDYVEKENCYFHLGTNNKYIHEILKTHNKIYTYNFNNLDLIDNDMNAFTNGLNHKNIKSEVLKDRLFDICTEIFSIKKSSKIFFVHDLGWLSNFLFFPLCLTENKIELVDKNYWKI